LNTDEILEYWANTMRAQHCTERTIRERMIFMRSVLWRTSSTDLLTIGKPALIAFLGRDGLTGRTKQNYRSALHTFFTWLQDEELRADNPAAKLPRPRVEPSEANPVTTAQLQLALDSGVRRRTRMMMLLYSYEGLRASEIAAVHGSNVDWERRRLLTIEGKGRKEVWRPITSIVWDAAQDFPRDDYWFPGQRGHVRGKSISSTLSAAFSRAGLDGHTGHDMRAWHATELIEAGVDAKTVQYSMRHGDMQSLDKYVRPSDRLILEAREQLPRVVVSISSRRREVGGDDSLAA
jgi:integrase/recombinase XerD